MGNHSNGCHLGERSWGATPVDESGCKAAFKCQHIETDDKKDVTDCQYKINYDISITIVWFLARGCQVSR